MVVAVLALCGSGGLQATPPFEGLGHIEGVYTTIDGHGISLSHWADTYHLRLLPDGSEVDWKGDDDIERTPHVVITCRAAGGYSPAKELQATWTIPVQGDFSEKLRSRIAKLGTDPYPEPVKGGWIAHCQPLWTACP